MESAQKLMEELSKAMKDAGKSNEEGSSMSKGDFAPDGSSSSTDSVGKSKANRRKATKGNAAEEGDTDAGAGEKSDEGSDDVSSGNSSDYDDDFMHANRGVNPSGTEASEGDIPKEDGLDDDLEYELTEKDIQAIQKEVENCLKEECEIKERKTDSPSTQPEDDINLKDIYPTVNALNLSLGDMSSFEGEYDRLKEHLSGGIKILANQLKRIFLNNSEEKEYRPSGRVSVKRLREGRLTSRMFSRRVEPESENDVAIMLLVDVSGSMYGTKELIAKQAAIGLAEVFSNLKIPFKVMSFSADGSYQRQNYGVIHTHYLNWKNTLSERFKLLNIAAGGNNFDGYSITYAGRLMKKRPESHKILIVVSDGQPACHYYRRNDGIKDTKDAIKEASKYATVFGVAIDANKDVLFDMYGHRYVEVNKIDTLFEELGNIIKKEIRSW